MAVWNSDNPSISADGSRIAFESYADDLVTGLTDANVYFVQDVYVRDVAAGTTKLASRNRLSATTTGNEASRSPRISRDGSTVVFLSSASNLETGVTDTNSAEDLFAFDYSAGTNKTVSRRSATATTGDAGVDLFDVSDNGQTVAFSSNATNLIAGDLNGASDVFVHDLSSTALELVSVDSNEVKANSSSQRPSISGDGRFVAFVSQASNLSPLSTDFSPQIYARDRAAGTTTLVSVNRLGTAGGNDTSDLPQISRDGSVVAFESYATNLQTGVSDSNSDRDVFVRNWRAASPVTETASRRSTGTSTGNRLSYSPSISEDGTTISFVSNGNNLVAGISDPIVTPDIFAVRSIGLSVNSVTADEGDSGSTNFQFTVTLLSPSTQTVTVDYETLDGSATTADNDYTAASGTLTFNPGETTKVITVSVVGDVTIEPNEVFSLRLFNAVNADIVVGNATGTIRDDDNLAVASVTINSGAAQRSNLETIDVRFTGATNIPDLITAGTIDQAVTLVTSTGASVSLTGARFAYTAAARTLTVDLTLDGLGGSARTMLADGRYELRLDTTLIHFAGNPARLLQDDATPDGFVNLSFHRFDSDFNGDGAVTYADRDLLFSHYGSRLGQLNYDLAFDLDGDGIINSRDYLWLRRRIGLSL
ncbi:MAG: Calx-beta domain-containing protein [Planctomycetaceae bacterium]